MNRELAPEISDLHQVNFVKPTCVNTKNSFYHIDNPSDESIRLELIFNAGSKFQSKKLQASFTSDLLLSGTPSKNSKEINESIDEEGGYIQVESDRDTIMLTVYCLAKNLEKIWDELEEALLNVNFPKEEFETLKAVKTQQFKVNSEKVSSLARREFAKKIFTKDTPYDSGVEIDDYQNITRQDIIDFYQEFIAKGLKGIFLVGNMSEEIKEKLDAFGTHFYGDKKVADTEYKSEVCQKMIDKEGAIQSAIRVGKTTVNRGEDDYVPLQILNTILGGYFGSRLMANIREDKGYTYGIGSGIAPLVDAAYFFISTEVGSDVKHEALAEIKKEIEILQKEPISESELSLVKNYTIGQFLKGSDGPFSMMDRFKSLWFFDLDYDYYENYMSIVKNISTQKLHDIAKKYLEWETMSIIVVG